MTIRPLVAAGVVLTLFLSGCGGDGGGRANSAGNREGNAVPLSPSQVLALMVKKTDALRSVRGSVKQTSYASGRVVRSIGGVAYRFKPQLAFKRDFSTQATGFDQQEILIGDAFYMTVPARRRSGRPWVEYAVGGSGARTRGKVDHLVAVAQQDDPSMNLRMFTASKDMHAVGTETIYGVSTTHYRGTYSVRTALARLRSGERAKAREIFAPVGTGEVSFDLWADGKQLPRRIRIVTPATDKVHWDMTTTYVGFNPPVSITPVPARLVTAGGWNRSSSHGLPARRLRPAAVWTDR